MGYSDVSALEGGIDGWEAAGLPVYCGTHVRSTDEVGRIRVVKTESKGKGNKRIRIEIVDA